MVEGPSVHPKVLRCSSCCIRCMAFFSLLSSYFQGNINSQFDFYLPDRLNSAPVVDLKNLQQIHTVAHQLRVVM